jgi:hypothetical protein
MQRPTASTGMIRQKITSIHAQWDRLLKLQKQHPRLVRTIRFLSIFSLFWLAAWNTLDPDFGWHLQAGNYFRHHGLPAHDIFTYTAKNFPWIDHEWGTDILISWLYQVGNFWLLSCLFAGLWTGSLFINAPKAKTGLLLAASAALLPFTGIRAIAWTVFFLALLMRITASRRSYVKFLVPLLFVAWANLHGGFIIGFVFLAYTSLKQRKYAWLIILGASILATFVNPYGPRLYVEIARTLFDSSLHHEIREWARFSIPRATVTYVFLWFTGFWIYSRKKVGNWLAFGPLLFLSGWSAVRNWPLFIVATMSGMSEYLDKTKKIIPDGLDRPKRLMITVFVLSFFGAVGASIYTYFPWHSRTADGPAQAAAYLAAHPCQGNLFNDYDYGGYLIWKLPDTPVYIDGRMPSWRDANGQKYHDRYTAIITESSARKREFQQYDIKCALVSNDGNFTSFIKDIEGSGWKTVYRANNVLLLEAPFKG